MMARSIILFGLICLQLCCLAALSRGQAEPPGETIINWVSGAWHGVGPGNRPSAVTRYGRFCCVVEGGLAIGSVETGSHTVFTTADGLLGGGGVPPDEVHIDDSGFIWAYSHVVTDDPRLPWQVFDGLRWAGVGDIGEFGVVDNRNGIWTCHVADLAHYRLSPPGTAERTEYYAPDYGLDYWPAWIGIDSCGTLWGRQVPFSGPAAVYSFDGQELRSSEPPEGFKPGGGAVDRGDNKWFAGADGDMQIARFDGETWDIWGSEDGLPADQSLIWNRFAFDEHSDPWAMWYNREGDVIVERRIMHLRANHWEEVAPPAAEGFGVNDITSDETGSLFAFGSLRDASAVFRLDDDAWEGPLLIREPTSLGGGGAVSEVGIDREDGVWFWCVDYTGESWAIRHVCSKGSASFGDFPDDRFWRVKVDAANNKWFGGTKLVVTRDMEHGYFACTPPQMLMDIAFGPDGTAYVACQGHLYQIRDGEVTVEDLPWCDGHVTDVLVGPDGTVYLAFGDDSDLGNLQGGIYFNRGAGWQNLPVVVEGYSHWPILGLELDASGRIWAVVYGGLAVFDGSQWTLIGDDGESVSERPSPLPPLTLDSDGNLWFFGFVYENQDYTKPSRWGLCRFDGANFTVWTQEDGILPDLLYYESLPPSRSAGAISEDQYGNMWAAGNGISLLLADDSLILVPSVVAAPGPQAQAGAQSNPQLTFSSAFQYMAPSANADLYTAIQIPSGQIFYVAPQGAAPAFPIFYAAFDGSTEFLKPGPNYEGPGSMPNTPDMKDLAAPALPLADPPAGQGPTGLALFAYPVPYFANVPLPAYSAIEDFVLLSTTLPDNAPTGTYTFHIGITAPSSIMNVYRTASTTFEVGAD